MAEQNRILIVSWTPKLVKSLKRNFGKDYKVSSTGKTGRRLKLVIEEKKPGFIFLDVFPHPYGIGALYIIHQFFNQVPVYLLSQSRYKKGIRRFDPMDDDYLAKLLDINELKVELRRILKEAPV